ncbi:unnamed protein product [Camellia sinensis]
MLRPASKGYSNGYHYHHQNGSGGSLSRRGNRVRRSRDYGGDGSATTRVSASDRDMPPPPPPPPPTDFDMAYFHSYAHVGIHEEMIKDRVRTETYRAAVMQHQNYIAGKVVVDVGCGTGILSIFCAQAGAKRVYAVDASDIAVQANEVVKANNLSDTVIVLHGRIENTHNFICVGITTGGFMLEQDVEIDEEVDVIISEWMGYMLLYEHAREHYYCQRPLAKTWRSYSSFECNVLVGVEFVDGGGEQIKLRRLYMVPITHPDRYTESIDFWRNVYGIDMSAMLPLAKQCAFEEPSVETISGENVLTWPHVAPFHGFAFWFDVEFSSPAIFPTDNNAPSSVIESPTDHPIDGSQRKKRANPNEALVLSTAPEDPPTHWQQTLIYFYDPIEVEQDQVISGSVTLSQSKENPRFMNIHLEYASGGRAYVKESVMR